MTKFIVIVNSFTKECATLYITQCNISRTSSFAGSCNGDDNSVAGISNCMEHMNELAAAQMFHSSVDSQRRVAYIAVQFSSISDASYKDVNENLYMLYRVYF